MHVYIIAYVITFAGSWPVAQLTVSLCIARQDFAYQCTRPLSIKLSATMAPTKAASPPGHTISSAVPAALKAFLSYKTPRFKLAASCRNSFLLI